MGKISGYAKALARKPAAAKAPAPKGAKAAQVPVLQPPASESEMPDAAPPGPPVQTSSTPKMVTASTRAMRKQIVD